MFQFERTKAVAPSSVLNASAHLITLAVVESGEIVCVILCLVLWYIRSDIDENLCTRFSWRSSIQWEVV